MINNEPTKSLVYGLARLPGCLAFADARTAADEAKEIIAIASARTWGEARAVNPHHTYNPVADLDDDPEDTPDDAAFDIREVGAVMEGDWPRMVTGRILDLVPKELWSTFGDVEFTALNGDCLEIPASKETEILAVLHEHGYEVTRDDELINILDGGTFLS
jgi:hypothetical protein